jgi:F0F1-type ATP synthase assembly protein I
MSTEPDLRSDATKWLHRSSASYELAFAPVLLALLGLWLDRTVGTTPVFTVTFAVLGVAGAMTRAWYGYRHAMQQVPVLEQDDQ